MDGELPVPVAVDLEDLVHETRNLDLEVVLPLRRLPRLVESDHERHGGAEVGLGHYAARHQIHVMPRVRRASVLPDQPDVLGTDEEGNGASDDGRYAWVGEFTASIVRPRHRSWMRSGDALITVPCRML